MNPLKYLLTTLSASIMFLSTPLIAYSIEDHGIYIALCAPSHSLRSQPQTSIITVQENKTYSPAQVLLQAVQYNHASHAINKLGSALLAEIPVMGLPFLWDNPCMNGCDAEYRIYAYYVEPYTHKILEPISPISDIITITNSPREQIFSTPSHAPFFLTSRSSANTHKKSRTIPFIIGTLGFLYIGATGIIAIWHEDEAKPLTARKKKQLPSTFKCTPVIISEQDKQTAIPSEPLIITKPSLPETIVLTTQAEGCVQAYQRVMNSSDYDLVEIAKKDLSTYKKRYLQSYAQHQKTHQESSVSGSALTPDKNSQLSRAMRLLHPDSEYEIWGDGDVKISLKTVFTNTISGQ